MKPRKPGIAKFNRFNHPLAQANMWGSLPLYNWQREVLEEISKPRARTAISTCNESGKTSHLVPVFGLSVMAAFPGATVFSTAGAEEQIKGQLFRYLSGKVRPFESQGWHCSTSDLTVTGPKIRGLQSRWVGRVPRDALTMEGYHGNWEKDMLDNWVWCPVAVILDEAKSLSEEIFQASWRIDPDWLFAVSTPGDEEGPFFEAIDPANLELEEKIQNGAA